MGVTFKKLLECMLSEITRREPVYLERFPVGKPDLAQLAVRYSGQPLCSEFSLHVLEAAFDEGLAFFAGARNNGNHETNADDPVIQCLCGSIVDAFCANQGVLDLRPSATPGEPVMQILTRLYFRRRTQTGLSYFVRRQGSKPLVLINPTGVPIYIWRSFLADPGHDFRIIVPERRGADLVVGGFNEFVDIETETADLVSILKAEMIDRINVVAWCNGARLGIDLAVNQPDRTASLILVSPSFKGIKDVPVGQSRFEEDIQLIFDVVASRPAQAAYFSTAISNQSKPPEWERLADDSSMRAQALFELPAREHANGILAPLMEPASFLNIARRVSSDESYPTNRALGDLATRTLVFMGSHDQIVNNMLIALAMQQHCRNSMTAATLRGAGHYIHDLQYHYFLPLLDRFIENRPIPATARTSACDWSPTQTTFCD